MRTKRLAFLSMACFALLHPLLTFAQQNQQPASPQQPAWNWPGPWHMASAGWGFWWIFPLLMLLMMIICVVIFFLGHRAGSGGHHHWGPWRMMYGPWGPGRSWDDPTSSALQILNERYAKGEIQKEEYEEKKAAILSSGQR